jgi:AcrR family transcriptional regulator
VTTEQAPRRRGRPASISSDDILKVVNDHIGEDWTITTIAAELGVTTAAIYYYFPNKTAILTAVGDLIVGELKVPATQDWREWLVEFGFGWHHVLLHYPFMADTAQWAQVSRPCHMDVTETALEVLTAAGFTPHDAVDVLAAITAASQSHAKAELAAATLPLTEVPTLPPLLESAIAHLMPRTFEESLRASLGIVVDGADALRKRRPRLRKKGVAGRAQ